jgi:transposase
MPQGFWLSDAQWERLAPLLPNKPRGVERVDDRRDCSGAAIRWSLDRGLGRVAGALLQASMPMDKFIRFERNSVYHRG